MSFKIKNSICFVTGANRGIETGQEEIFPDKVSLDFSAKFRINRKALEREWSVMLPE